MALGNGPPGTLSPHEHEMWRRLQQMGQLGSQQAPKPPVEYTTVKPPKKSTQFNVNKVANGWIVVDGNGSQYVVPEDAAIDGIIAVIKVILVNGELGV